MINDFSTQADAMGKFFCEDTLKITIETVIIQREFRALVISSVNQSYFMNNNLDILFKFI